MIDSTPLCSTDEVTSEDYRIMRLGTNRNKENLGISVEIGSGYKNLSPLELIIDTGADVSLISRTTYESMKSSLPKLCKTPLSLQTYTDDPIVVLGVLHVYIC